MRSLRSDTLTMRVTGVRITVFCSAIVIDVIVHCHTAGALLSQSAENNCPYQIGPQISRRMDFADENFSLEYFRAAVFCCIGCLLDAAQLL